MKLLESPYNQADFVNYLFILTKNNTKFDNLINPEAITNK